MKNKIKTLILFSAIIVNSGLLFVNIYNSMVDAPNWGANIPSSIDISRNYFASKSPADFFKLFGIVIHILGINCVIRFWRTDKQIRLYNISALALILVVDLITFAYFFPRNEILFNLNNEVGFQTLTQALREWEIMNWIRFLITLGIIIFYSLSLNNFFLLRQKI